MIYIENEGALFRGPARGVPQEVWSPSQGKFVAYTGSKDDRTRPQASVPLRSTNANRGIHGAA